MESTNTRNVVPNTSVPSVVGEHSISLASIEKKKLKETNEYSVTLPTYIITCVFLIALCVFLISILVFIGHSLLHDNKLSSRLARNINLGPLNNSVIVKALELANNSDKSIQFDNKYKFDEKQINLIKKFKLNDSRTSTNQQNTKSEVKYPLYFSTTTTVNDTARRRSTNKKNIAKFNMKLSNVVDKLTYRLPSEIHPENYKLYLHPNLNESTYTGNVRIRLGIQKPISFIPIHAKKLTISATKLFKLVKSDDSNELEQSVNIKQAFDYPDYEYWITEVDKKLDIGEYLLDLEFNGSLSDRIVGFYGSTYHDKQTNQTRKIATSKFEPTYARQAFPCFDEPAMKAEFQVSLVRPTGDGYHSLSNMEIDTEVAHPDNPDLTITKFHTSVPMSTYLACFIVSDFISMKFDIDAHGIGENFYMRVFATPAQLNKIQFAGETGAKAIEYYLQYFQIKYPLPKLDMAAIPDFVSGAMEHWGLVTYRETSLLYDPAFSSTVNRQRVAAVVAHELAHMWFGNLVTMAWWNELWLNEGFASYMEYKCIDAMYPSFGMPGQFLVDDLHPVLPLDATLGSHPIVQKVENPDQITEIFDTITYNKGASVIRMLEDFIGPDIFQQSVSNYLSAHEYNNAETTDLLAEIDKLVTDKDATLFLNTWIKQKGFPYVTVAKTDVPNKYLLTQKRFLIDPESYLKDDMESEFNYRWEIPLTYHTDLTAEGDFQRALFPWTDNSFEITVEPDHTWIKLNKDQIGYYRVLYPEEMWNSFTKALVADVDSFSATDRAQLIDDAFSLAEAQMLSFDIALELTRFLSKDVAYIPWATASSKFTKINNLVYFTSVYEKFQKYSQTIIDAAYAYVGWDVVINDENHLKNRLRTTVLDLACQMGHKDCLARAGAEFSLWIEKPDPRPHPDIRNIVYFYGLAVAGNAETWEKMWQLFADEEDAQEKQKLMSALSAIKDPLILNKLLQLAKTETTVIRGQDYFTCLENIAANRIGEPLVWDFVRNEWKYLVDRFTLNDRYLGRMVSSVTSRFVTQVKLDEMEAFFAKYPDAGAGTTARIQALEKVINNINWLEQNTNYISSWLDKNN